MTPVFTFSIQTRAQGIWITGLRQVAHPGMTSQPLRRPSATRFHCATLSAIMRVDFIAAWLSWA